MARPSDTILSMVGMPIMMGVMISAGIKTMATGQVGSIDVLIFPGSLLLSRMNFSAASDDRLLTSSLLRVPTSLVRRSINSISLGLQRSLNTGLLTGVAFENLLMFHPWPIKTGAAIALAAVLSRAQDQGEAARTRAYLGHS